MISKGSDEEKSPLRFKSRTKLKKNSGVPEEDNNQQSDGSGSFKKKVRIIIITDIFLRNH